MWNEMASAVCQNQFLGSRISLVSKSEIRYEGILYALDLSETTISLAKVRSFGTEDRPTDRPVPPREDVYEYIVFRGADIKVIDVVEPPKHAANSGMAGGSVPHDPAIVDFSHSMNGHFGHFEGGRMRQPARRGGPQMYMGQNGGQRRRGGFPDEGQNGRGNLNRSFVSGGGGGPRQNYGPPGGRNNYGGNFRQGGYGPRDNGGQFQPRGGRMTTPNRGGNYGQPRRGGRQGGGGVGNRSPFRNRGMNQAAFPPKVAFDGDFDFEKANEELISQMAKAKLDDSTEAKSDDEGAKDEQENKEARIFYKKDNFFDSISCEALERSKGNIPRVDWKAERKLNAETFGISQTTNGSGNFRERRGRIQYQQQRMPRGMPNVGPVGGGWMSPNRYNRGGNYQRRPRMRN